MRDRWETNRVEAFSDGVFAIAITLLVLDIRVPLREFDDLWAGIVHEWPAYLGFITSFITIGGIWLLHHGVFRRLAFANNQIVRINLLLLMGVSFLPFPTRLAADAIRNEDAERTAIIFYGATLLVISLLMAALWASAARDRSLLAPDVDETEIERFSRIATPNIGFYVGATALAHFAPRAAAGLYLAIAVISVLRARGDRGQSSRAGSP
jgi:uncharacterized membrane protein